MHTDGWSRLITKNPELLEETVMAALKEEKEITEILVKTDNGLSVTFKILRKQQIRMITYQN